MLNNYIPIIPPDGSQSQQNNKNVNFNKNLIYILHIIWQKQNREFFHDMTKLRPDFSHLQFLPFKVLQMQMKICHAFISEFNVQ